MKCPTPIQVMVTHCEESDTEKLETVPCGKCLICLSNKRREWIVRLYFEHKYSSGSHFVTLTYHPKYLPYDGKLSKRELQLFMKRLRKLNTKLRYYAVGEYGSKGGRPHYHLLLFGDLNPNTVRKAWTKGIVHIGKVSFASIAYCTKYIVQAKKDGMFTLMSRRYAIGGKYLTDMMIAWHKEDDRNYCIVEGRKVKLPRFFKTKIWNKNALKKVNHKSKWESIRTHRQRMRQLKESGIQDIKGYMKDETLAFVSRIQSKVEYSQTL